MIDFFRKYLRARYRTLNKIFIDKNKLLFNLNLLKNIHPEAELIPVLKANAYGHGLKIVCKILNKTSVKTIAVDSYPEVQIALKYFKKNILLISEMSRETYAYCNLNKTEFCVYNEETLKFLANKFGKKIKIHLFFNTGMNREGIKEAKAYIDKNIKYLRMVSLVGACSHLLASELGDTNEINRLQEKSFANIVSMLSDYGFRNLTTHLANSGGIFSLKENYSAYRAGISLYGFNILNKDHHNYQIAQKLQACLSLNSTIVSLSELKPGENVSYSFSYKTKKPCLIAVIPFGYFEGLSRKLSNKTYLRIKAQGEDIWGKIVGSVCMNLSCLELDIKHKDIVKLGDNVEIISTDKKAKNFAKNLAKEEGTIVYETLSRLRENIRREII